jgi:hypothetical protein
MFGALLNDARASMKHRKPQPPPVLLIVIDQQRRPWIGPDVCQTAQPPRIGLRLGIDGVIEPVSDEDKADRHDRRLAAIGRRKMPDPSPGHRPSEIGRDGGDAAIMRQPGRNVADPLIFSDNWPITFLEMDAATWLRTRAVELGAAVSTAAVLIAGLAVGVPFLRARIPEVFLYSFCCVSAVFVRAVLDLSLRSVVFAARQFRSHPIVIPALSRYPAGMVR